MAGVTSFRKCGKSADGEGWGGSPYAGAVTRSRSNAGWPIVTRSCMHAAFLYELWLGARWGVGAPPGYTGGTRWPQTGIHHLLPTKRDNDAALALGARPHEPAARHMSKREIINLEDVV